MKTKASFENGITSGSADAGGLTSFVSLLRDAFVGGRTRTAKDRWNAVETPGRGKVGVRGEALGGGESKRGRQEKICLRSLKRLTWTFIAKHHREGDDMESLPRFIPSSLAFEPARYMRLFLSLSPFYLFSESKLPQRDVVLLKHLVY